MEKTVGSTIKELPRIWTPEAEWKLHEAPGEPTFLFPAFGRGSYDKVVGQVLANRERGLNLATPEQSAFMLDEAYNSADEAIKKSPRSEFIREDIMYDCCWFWVPSVNVWTPNGCENPGMYSIFDKKGQGLNRIYALEELEDRLSGGDTERRVRFSQDRTVAFAPRNTIKSKEHEKGTLSQDGAFIAVYGPKGAESLDRVAKQFRFKPYSRIRNNNSDKPVQTLSALGGSRSFGDYWLVADFDSDGDSRFGYVVSVSGSQNIKNPDN
jgi:hypothetical protein